MVTILGGSGFVGAALINYLKNRSIPYFAPHRSDWSWIKQPNGDIIYCIGLTADYRHRPFDTIEAHVTLLSNLLQHCQFTSFTYLSSTRVYQDAADTSENSRLVAHPQSKDSLYNLSKLVGESLCYHSGRASVKIVRLSNVIGLRDDNDLFINQILNEGMLTGKIILDSSPENEKDYIYVDDVVKILYAIAKSPDSGIFNLASGELISNEKILSTIKEVLSISYSYNATVTQRPAQPINIEKIKSVLNITPLKFDEYFQNYLKIFKEKWSAK